MELAHQLTKDVYSKNNLSRKTKIRQYNTIIKAESLYTIQFMFGMKSGEIKEEEGNRDYAKNLGTAGKPRNKPLI